MAPEDPPAPARRRFLGRIGALLGGLAASGRPAQADAATVTSRGTPAPQGYGFHLPELGDDDAHAAAIQSAIDEAAERGGGVVLLPAATLVLREPLRMSSHVTLRGMSIRGSVLQAGDSLTGALVRIPEGAEGVAIESLALDGAERAANGLHLEGPVTFCVLRRLLVRATTEDGILVGEGPHAHLAFEQLTIETVGGDGLRLSFAACTSVFLSEVSINGFGRAVEGAHGVRLGGRVQVTQLHIDPVTRGQTGVGFRRGSNRSTLTNYYIRADGGTAVATDPDLEIAIGEGALP